MSTTARRGTDHLAPLALGVPRLRYVDADDAPGHAHGWHPHGTTAWSHDDGRLRLHAGVARAPAMAHGLDHPGRTLTLSATALRPVRVGECAVELHASTGQPPHVIDGTLAWRALTGPLVLGSVTPLLLRWRDANGRSYELRSAGGPTAAALDWRGQLLRIRVYLDAAALHPRWSFADRTTTSTAAPRWPAGHELAVTLALREVDDAWTSAPVLAGRLPRGAESAVVLTDHCDFDTTERLHAFALGDGRHRGWLGRGLRFTKGVFALASAVHGRPPAPTLLDAPYRALVERLHADGSEIAPHGVNESGNVPAADFHRALDGVARAFAPRTWIDHGLTLHYCYTMGGADHAEYALLRRLRAHGFTTLWSYHDAPVDASGSLDTAAATSRGVGVRAARAARHLVNGRPLVAAHYARSALRARLDGPLGDAVGRSLSALREVYLGRGRPAGARVLHAARSVAATVGAVGRGRAAPGTRVDPYGRDELLAMAPLVYPERGVPLAQARPDDLLLFATTEVLHTRDAYTPDALQRLIAARGVHVGHSYLLNRLPYIAGLFADGEPPRLGDAWADFVDALASATADGRVWNPPVCELAEWLRAARQVTTLPCGRDAVAIRNPQAVAVRDFTLLLPPHVAPADVRWNDRPPVGTRRWHDWLVVWGDLARESHTVVRWGGP